MNRPSGPDQRTLTWRCSSRRATRRSGGRQHVRTRQVSKGSRSCSLAARPVRGMTAGSMASRAINRAAACGVFATSAQRIGPWHFEIHAGHGWSRESATFIEGRHRPLGSAARWPVIPGSRAGPARERCRRLRGAASVVRDLVSQTRITRARWASLMKVPA